MACGPTHHEGCPCHEAGWRRRMAGALEEAQTERDTAAEHRIERDEARARVQQLGDEGRRALRERDQARAEVARLRAGLSMIRTDYPAAAQACNAILWPMPEASNCGRCGGIVAHGQHPHRMPQRDFAVYHWACWYELREEEVLGPRPAAAPEMEDAR